MSWMSLDNIQMPNVNRGFATLFH